MTNLSAGADSSLFSLLAAKSAVSSSFFNDGTGRENELVLAESPWNKCEELMNESTRFRIGGLFSKRYIGFMQYCCSLWFKFCVNRWLTVSGMECLSLSQLYKKNNVHVLYIHTHNTTYII